MTERLDRARALAKLREKRARKARADAKRERASAKFAGYRQQVARELYDLVLKRMAAFDAVGAVNSELERLGLHGVSLDENRIRANLVRLTTLEVDALMVRESTLPLHVKRAMVARLMARLVPAAEPPQKRGPSRPNQSDLARELRASIERQYPANLTGKK